MRTKPFKKSVKDLIRMLQQPRIMIHSDDDDDEVMSIDKNFHVPVVSGAAGPSLGTDLLINKKKVSSDVLSISSRSSSGSESSGGDTTESEVRGIGSGLYGGGRPAGVGIYSSRSSSGVSSANSDASSSYEDDDDAGGHDVMATRMSAERSRIEAEMNEKKEILYQMDRLESKGYKLPKKFTLQSDIEEMRVEYNRVVREKEVDASIRFQRKMMMALVTGVEFLNDRYDPFDIRLGGWSDSVHENINDYDDIFEELHDKYKGSGKKMAPELRLLMSLSGSAFMFHFTNRMLKQSDVPGVEEVLRSDPNLMKQFQAAALNRQAQVNRQTGGGGLFGMMGNLFGGGRATMPMPTSQQQVRMRGPQNVEDIIDDVSAKINVVAPANNSANRYETLSVSDEEITSIIEDTTDLNGIMNAAGAPSRKPRGRGAAGGNKRTLQL